MMRHHGTRWARTTTAVCGVALAAMTLGACGGDGDDDPGDSVAPFTASTACGLPAADVAGLVGTDRFEVGSTRGSLDAPDGSEDGFRCEIIIDDAAAVTVVARVDDAEGRSTVEGVIDRSEVDFPVVEGQGRGGYDPAFDDTDASFDAVWACEQVTGEVFGNAEDWDESALKTLVEQAADTAGCATA